MTFGGELGYSLLGRDCSLILKVSEAGTVVGVRVFGVVL
jgi:hypothetical protein